MREKNLLMKTEVPFRSTFTFFTFKKLKVIKITPVNCTK